MIWTDRSVPFPLDKRGSGILANPSLRGTKVTLSYSASPVCSRPFAEACPVLQALRWSWQHQQLCHFSCLVLSDSHSVFTTLSSLPSFLLYHTLWHIWMKISSLLLHLYQATTGPRSLTSSGKRVSAEEHVLPPTLVPSLIFATTNTAFC